MTKPAEDFRQRGYGKAKRCADCTDRRSHEASLANRRAWIEKRRRQHQADPEAAAEYRLKEQTRRYRMTVDAFRTLLAAQGGGCAICGVIEPGGRGNWHIDHDHSCCHPTGRGRFRACGKCNRALLCHGCNIGLGGFNDDIDRMKAAIKYLEEYRG